MKKIMEMLQNMKTKNEKKDNKGFSLVELIIVIAIMAILVGVVGTQVLPYLNKSKLEKDRQIVSAYSTAAVSAYSMVADELADTSQPLTINVYAATGTGDDAKVAAKIKELTYENFPTNKFKSNEGYGATDVKIEITPSTRTVKATVKGTGAKAADIVVESDM